MDQYKQMGHEEWGGGDDNGGRWVGLTEEIIWKPRKICAGLECWIDFPRVSVEGLKARIKRNCYPILKGF